MAARLHVVRADDGFDLPPLGKEDGSAFGWEDRWNFGTDVTGKLVTDLSDWQARDMAEMVSKDYKAIQIEAVLSLPLLQSQHSIEPAEGDKGEAAWLRQYWDTDAFSGGCRTSLQQIIARLTSAFWYKRAYFEKIVRKGTGKFKDKFVYDDVAFRPQTTCRLMRDPLTGRFRGFEQEAYYLGPEISQPDRWPVRIPENRAFVFTHGTHRDPLNGVSDLEVAYWAWKTKQKVLMLWLQYLQAVSLPRVTVKAMDQTTANQIATEIARLKSSGVLPLSTPGGPDSVAVDTLDVSGKGAEQFQRVIDWLDTAVTQSVLAGFLDLTASIQGTKGGPHGSYALSKDASDFFLQSLESKAREIEEQIRQGLFAPLIFWNFGPNAAVPRLKFKPLADLNTDTAVALLKQAMAAPPGGPVPTSFISALAQQVAASLGMDADAIAADFKASFDAAAAEAKQQQANEIGQRVAGVAGVTGAAQKALSAKKGSGRNEPHTPPGRPRQGPLQRVPAGGAPAKR